MDPCPSSRIITDSSKCPSNPSPSPAPPAPTPAKKAGPNVLDIVKELLKILQITDVDAETCVEDVGNAGVFLKDFGDDVKSKNYGTAGRDLASAISSLSTAVSDCKIQEIQTKLDALAAAIKWANISTSGIDNTVRFIVDASDLWNGVEALATAVQGKDPSQIATALQNLISEWTSIFGPCTSKACKFVDGFLRLVQVVSPNIKPCEDALVPVYENLTLGVQLFQQKDFKGAVGSFAKGLDELAVAVDNDACGIQQIVPVLEQVAPKLANAIIKIGESNTTEIIVGFMNVYDTLYNAVEDLSKGDIAGFGMQMGKLLQELKASNCETKFCIVFEGILSALQIESSDYTQCTGDLDNSWDSFQSSFSYFKSGEWKDGVDSLGDAFVDVAKSVNDCDIPEIAQVFEKAADRIKANSSVTPVIESIVSILVEGADVTLDIQKSIQDFNSKSWNTFGQDLGNIASIISSSKCTSFVCKILEGILNGAEIAFEHLEGCESDLRAAENDFIAGASNFHGGQFKTAVVYWANGLNEIAHSVSDCGLKDELAYLEQEANVLGIANVSIINEVITVLADGSDFYEEIFAAFQGIENHDWKSAGANLQKVLDDLSKWTSGHACTSDFCYVVIGIMQYFGEIEGSITECKDDFEEAFNNFTDGFKDLVHDDKFSHDKGQISEGIREIGQGMKLVAKGVSDCQLQELADLLTKLAAKLGIAPEVQWIEDILKILIEGVQIENEIGDACTDFADKNWPGFGYNIMKLVKTLL